MLRLFCYALLLWTHLLFSGNHSAVTYHMSNGRFGDNLLTYFHAKWISYQAGIPVLYKPFPYAEDLIFSETEERFGSSYAKEIWLSETDAKFSTIHQDNTLFQVAYFSELSWGGNCLSSYPDFHINWDDPGFHKVLKEAVVPKKPLYYNVIPPNDRISVAIHLRNGGRFETDLHDVWALKAPRIDFFIQYLKYLHDFLHRVPFFVHVFTDHERPDEVKREFQRALQGRDIIVSSADKSVGWSGQVLEDFFSMMLFDCSIHGDSNFSVCAGILADHDIEIRPVSTKIVNKKQVIKDVVMRLHFDKEGAPEYRIISGR